MRLDVGKTLQRALSSLETERGRIDRQIAAIRTALDGVDGRPRTAGFRRRTAPVASDHERAPRRRPRMSEAARRAASRRMKAYWAKRRREGTKKSKRAP
jgi:hypothetical protein